MNNLNIILDDNGICASSPCRIDFAGTLDISTFSFPLWDLCPVTFNMAISLRTRVWLKPYKDGFVKVQSKGFEDAEFKSKEAPYDHPLGLIFAICDAYNITGAEILIESSSPPKSALGGSSVASVALVSLFMKVLNGPEARISAKEAALSAHLIEASVAGVPCGLQDHLAAAYGGANAWHWNHVSKWPQFNNTSLLDKRDCEKIKNNFIVAYTGKTHHSHSVNTEWREQFVSGMHRDKWRRITELSHSFCNLFLEKDFASLVNIVQEEVALRSEMTPDVLDNRGKLLKEKADEHNCGARFTGAGGGGCVWAVGKEENIANLKKCWEKEILNIKDALILDVAPDPDGILFEC